MTCGLWPLKRTPIFFSKHRKENGRARSKEKMFGGLSGCNIPQSLYAGIGFADHAEHFEACAARRETDGQRKILRVSYPLRFHARITPLLPHIGKRNSLPLRRRAGEGELPRRGKRGRPGPRPRPAVYWCIAVWLLLNFTQTLTIMRWYKVG